MGSRRLSPRPRSLRGRTTMAVALLTLLFLGVIGATADFLVMDRLQIHAFREAQRAATDWIGAFRPGAPPPTPAVRGAVDLLQLVDTRGRVVAASDAAAGMPRLSTLRPPDGDRIQDGVTCFHDGGCVLVSAVLPPPLYVQQVWRGEPHVVYAGMAQPPILAGNRLEILTAAAILLTTGLVAWGNWWMAGRSLRPVAEIREAMADITVSDLSRRVPEPSGRTEYTLLARTANQTLARLEEAVSHQRRFASTTSHELRSPLAGLRALLEEAVLYPGEVDPQVTVREALAVSRRLETIVDDLLVLARLRAGDPAAQEPLDLGALVREEAPLHCDRVTIHVCARPGMTVRGNRIQLARILQNLLANACRHAASRIDVTAERGDGMAVVTVTDDGEGIAPQDRERVFERFLRLDDARRREPGGSGLGLAISRDIATVHGGTLVVEDAPHGARFVLRLPLEDRPRDGPGAADG
ncbi:sensor histidine kinase [Microbispora sp. ATCC PTA-5024]|uniref:sensor histidine kinase n=1 Tax=Microbispora sp. ATCC PTA-5024 TaxID=316330 RepID=UPI000403A58C|nr:HAMP domain-containing sensor histidine kinase [Microbispora sp. ATCC PTA-5024]